MNRTENLAARIVEESKMRPADAVLREQLKSSLFSRAGTAAVADLVFTYFRWLGWLNTRETIAQQFEHAREIDTRFNFERERFSTDELLKANPSWARTEIDVSRDWLLTLQTRPVLWLRAKQGTGAQLAAKLSDCIQGPDGLTDTLEYVGSKDLFRPREFHAGEFEVKDIASQLVSRLCASNPGEIWWDACAGEGGKTLHFSDLMKNKGLIWATDRSQRRLGKLKQRASRAGVFNYRVASWDGSAKLPTKTRFDGVLVDAPCTGAGTWQRNPQARWTTNISDVRELAAIQQRLVMNAAAAVKPGGKLIYAVCTLTQTETDAVADLCSQQLSQFEPIRSPAWTNAPQEASGRIWICPQKWRGNGMFLAVWRRLPPKP